jgi:uncharacterized protein YbjT (DUF2867 family)
MTSSEQLTMGEALTLVLTASGKTGRRVADRLEARGVPIRRGSRSGEVPFEWNDRTTWEPALAGVQAAYVVYTPDLAVPAAPPAIRDFTELAVRSGVKKLVLLSGRGEEEAQRCERIVQDSGVDSTIVRASWFCQNFSEGAFLDLVVGGEVALPAGSVKEPFIDADDIADVAVAALTESGHAGQVYEVTGPRLLTFVEAVADIADAAGRPIRYVQIPMEAFVDGLTQAGVPADYVELLKYLFTTVLDGRNEKLTDGVQRALGRAPRDFREYAKSVAATGVWNGREQGA